MLKKINTTNPKKFVKIFKILQTNFAFFTKIWQSLLRKSKIYQKYMNFAINFFPFYIIKCQEIYSTGYHEKNCKKKKIFLIFWNKVFESEYLKK